MSFFPLGIFIVAALYASVGHGGASGYLALGVLASLPAAELRPQALVLNLFVSGLSAWRFGRAGYFRKDLFFPLITTSIPAAYLCARLVNHPAVLQGVLAAALFFAAAKLWGEGSRSRMAPEARRVSKKTLLAAGGFLGALAGLTGVGGGIYLSPLLLLAGWAKVKECAAVSAAFIWVNSASGLVGLWQAENLSPVPWPWILAALAGGFLGSRLGAGSQREGLLKRVLAGVLLLAAFKLAAVVLRPVAA